MPQTLNDVIDLNLTTTPAIGGLSDDPIRVEVWVVLDYDFAKQFNFDRTQILKYMGPFFHGINTRYADPGNGWDVQFLIAGLTVVTDRSQQPWMESNSQGGGNYEINFTIKSLSVAVQNGALPKADLVALITNTEMTSGGQTGVAGVAYLKGVCREGGMHTLACPSQKIGTPIMAASMP